MKPFADSCEQNKHAIFGTIQHAFKNKKNILEIGSGTGQHAVFFAAQLPNANWQPSEQEENIPGILAWLEDYPHRNISTPITLNVKGTWPSTTFDGVFSANTIHIMDWSAVITLFEGVGTILEGGGTFCLYGPFNYQHKFTVSAKLPA